ncbi:hypothetical protein PC110_g18986 [Phytophthora cactorum]|uniref:HAT C-terminal dimerisation domain-containing protein n=1 Tax=Phytophthora cactorum TaxID=29920 RepID=A0A329RIY6_9STRA|nr:hypothetical protein PC110_g18986 [Phytophthora cactorum]
MVALQTIKNRTELRRHTCFAPLRANATRWSSTFMMLERYVRIRDTIKRVDAVYDLVSRGTEADLTPEELQALNPFELEAAASKPTLPSRSSRARTRARSDAEDFAAALLQSRPIPEQLTPRYNPIVVVIPPTSNHCERLFSQCKLVTTCISDPGEL